MSPFSKKKKKFGEYADSVNTLILDGATRKARARPLKNKGEKW
jgi:hypothetical protein